MKLKLAIIISILALTLTAYGGHQRPSKKAKSSKDRPSLDSATYSKLNAAGFIRKPEGPTEWESRGHPRRVYRYYTFNGLYYRTPHCDLSEAPFKDKSLDNAITHCIENVVACWGLNYCENGKTVQFLSVVISPTGNGMKEAVAEDEECEHISITYIQKKQTSTATGAQARPVKRHNAATGYRAYHS